MPVEKLNRLIGNNVSYQLGELFRMDQISTEFPHASDMDITVICITIFYEDVVATQANRETHETTFVYYRRPLLDSLERQSIHDTYS